jgi:hypothetical protein
MITIHESPGLIDVDLNCIELCENILVDARINMKEKQINFENILFILMILNSF